MTGDTGHLADWQIDLGGILIGRGTNVPLRDIEGLGTPDRRSGDRPIPGEDGNYPGKDTYAPRVLRISAGIRTPGDPAAALDQFAALEQAADTEVRLTPGAVDVLRIRRPGGPVRRLYGRLAGVEAVSLADAPFGWIPIQISFLGLDPAWCADTLSGLNLPLDISNQDKQGFTAPLRAPITTGTADPASRPGWALNSGNRPAWPTVRIVGPVVNPRVWIAGLPDAVLAFSVVLGDGESLDVETRPGTRTVMRNGQGSAAGTLVRPSRLDRFFVPPGRSEVRWSAQDATGTSRLVLTWRDAASSI
ncbi:hypothetical protein OH807_18445 [Kitasatospora sp. NBC_01560]|uniref:hypothetical protein n=1 Tax=Kitasatospora sp. NBC_01560 TaxID=2975965 RepID=UPI00386E06E9